MVYVFCIRCFFFLLLLLYYIILFCVASHQPMDDDRKWRARWMCVLCKRQNWLLLVFFPCISIVFTNYQTTDNISKYMLKQPTTAMQSVSLCMRRFGYWSGTLRYIAVNRCCFVHVPFSIVQNYRYAYALSNAQTHTATHHTINTPNGVCMYCGCVYTIHTEMSNTGKWRIPEQNTLFMLEYIVSRCC